MFAQFSKLFFNSFTKKKNVPLLLGGLGFSYLNYTLNQKRFSPQCCGIIGILSVNKEVEHIIMEGIELLQNRGYDSCGMTTMVHGQKDFVTTKIASNTLTDLNCITKMKETYAKKHHNSYQGIGHTRWATCGGKTDENAHPHFDTDERIALVHNGTIDNYKELKEELLKTDNVTIRSQTDTEVIAQLIGLELRKGGNLFEAVSNVIETKIVGQWGLVIMDKQTPNKMVVARNGSPILIGVHDDAIFVGSERIAFEKYTSNFIAMKDGEIIELDLANRNEFYKLNEKRKVIITDKTKVETKPRQPYEHFFMQEIFEQPETLLRALGHGARISGRPDCSKLGGLEPNAAAIRKIDHCVVVACGTSYYACLFAHHIFKRLGTFASMHIIEGSEFTHYDLPPKEVGGMICVSQSGETADVRKGQEMAKREGIFTIGVINTIGSQIAANVDCGVYLHCGREVAVAATKSFTSQCVALILIALFVSYHKEADSKEKVNQRIRIQVIRELRQIPLAVGQNLHDLEGPCKAIAKLLANLKSIILLGKGPGSAIAKEGALKLKELTYIHAEAFSAGELKHGPLALINPDDPKTTAIILIICDDEYLDEMRLSLSEVNSRQALTIVISDCADRINKNHADHIIEIQGTGILSTFFAVLPLQLITYEICKILKRNPDMPRNLAKCVTVK